MKTILISFAVVLSVAVGFKVLYHKYGNSRPTLALQIDDLRAKCANLIVEDPIAIGYIKRWNDPASMLARGIVDACVIGTLRSISEGK